MKSWRFPERVSRCTRVTFAPGMPLTPVQVPPVSGGGMAIGSEGSGAFGGGAYLEGALLHRHLSDRGGAAMDDDKKQPQGSLNEGEGSKTADKQYRQGATNFAKRTDTLQKGIEAEREVENYRDEYERAEKSGRSHGAGDLESDLEGKN